MSSEFNFDDEAEVSGATQDLEKQETALVDELIKELEGDPKSAVKFVQAISMITKPWEPLGNNGEPVNEVPVPAGVNPREFRSTATAAYISGYRMTTIFGNQVAELTKGTPKWRVTINGVPQTEAPFVKHSKTAEEAAKKFAEQKLRELGYVIG